MSAKTATALLALAIMLPALPATAQSLSGVQVYEVPAEAGPETPSPPPEPSAVVITPSPGRGYTVEHTRLAQLTADPQARAIIDDELPGLINHPYFPELRSGSIVSLIPLAQGMITAERLRSIQARLDAIQ
jgi:hypothetical protein